jgi:thiamine biosynthesis protein ThiS
MRIFFNGQAHEIEAQATIATLLQRLQLQPRYVAVEVNLQLIPRDRHDQHVLQADDRLEVVTLVGGG